MQEVQATVAKANASFQTFGSKASESFKKITKSLEENAQQMQDFGANATQFLSLPLALAGGASIKLASDFEESLNKVNVSFGASADSVKEWSKTSVESMGLASGTALDSAALFGDMATSMGIGQAQASNMSKSLVQLGADMASFKNVPIEQAMQALNGVFTGETESLKMLGVVMTQTQLEAFALSEGIQKNIKDMTEAEMINLRYAFVMSKTKNAQGDFARTSEGSANQMRIFGETLKEIGTQIGQVILPTFTKFITKVNDVLKSFANTSEETKTFTIAVGALAIALPPLAYAIGLVGASLTTIATGFRTLLVLVRAIGVPLAILSGLMYAFDVNLEDVADSASKVFAKLSILFNTIVMSAKSIGQTIYQSFQGIKKSFKNLAIDIRTLQDEIGFGSDENTKRIAELQKEVEQLDFSIAESKAYQASFVMKSLGESTTTYFKQLSDSVTGHILRAQDAMANNKSWFSLEMVMRSQAQATSNLKDEGEKLKDNLEEIKNKADEAKKKMEELRKQNLDFAKTLNDAVIKALENKNESIIESVKVTQEMIESEKEALEDLSKTYEDEYEKIRDTIDDNFKTQQDQLKDRYEQEIDNEKDLTQTKIDEVEKRRKNLENQIKNEIALNADRAYEEKKQSILNEMFQYKNLKTREEVLNAISKLTIEREKDLNSDGNSLKLEAIEQFTDEENKIIRDRLNEYRKLEYSNLTDRIEAIKKESQNTLSTREKMYQNDLAMLTYFKDQEHEKNKANLTRNLALAKQESDEKIAYFNAEIKLKEKGLTDLSSEEKKQMVAKRILLSQDHEETKKLLNEFNKDYYIAGRDFASELLKGLESKKSDITKLMGELATPYKPSEPVKSVLEQGKEFGKKVTDTILNSVKSIIPNSSTPTLNNFPSFNNGFDSSQKTFVDLKKDTAQMQNETKIFLDSREITKKIAPNLVDTVRTKTGLI
jgi:hypothetical protein